MAQTPTHESKMEQLPTPDMVLNKLKSDGTFDQFRKSCLTAIEAEPSFRAHGEHMEVLSRRYLQDFKWKENTSKNEVRTSLRRYVLGVIANPELQVGTPLGALVEKALERKTKELLPKISDALEAVHVAKPVSAADSGSLQPPSGTTVPSSATIEPSSSRKGSDIRSLPLPIEIPGLNTSRLRDTATTNDTSTKLTKPKPKVTDSTTTKDASNKGTQKPKSVTTSTTVVTGVSKGTAVKEGGKQKEKDDKTGTEKEAAPEEGRERGKNIPKPKKTREDKTPATLKEAQDKVTAKSHASVGKEKGADSKENSADSEFKSELPETSKMQQKMSGKVGEKMETDVQSNTEEAQETYSSRRKQAFPKRRSARIASLSEVNEEAKKTPEPEQLSEGEKQKATAAASDNDPSASEREDRKEQKHTRRRLKAAAGRKRARVLSSSSEGADEEVESVSEDEQSYVSETEQGKDDERSAKRQKTRERASSVTEMEASSLRRSGRKRAIQSPENEGKEVNSSSAKKMKGSIRRQAKAHKKFSRTKKTTSPVVVTRYNRRVKPNRRYSPSGELSELEESSGWEEVEQGAESDDEGSSSEEDKPATSTGKTGKVTSRK